MGNESSHKMKNNITFNEKPVEKMTNCLIYEAEENNTKLTVFEELTVESIPYYQNLSALERNIKNLILHRHPTIARYYGSWKTSGKNFLAIERCKLLQSVLDQQNDIQICLGLKNVLSSLIFLTEKAGSRHLNVSVSSIVEAGSQWKLMGFENLWKNVDVNTDLLEKSKCFRDLEAIDPNEIKNNGLGIEQYSFAVLCETVLRKDSQIPHIKEFIDYCKTHLKHSNPSLRPSLSAILLHPYFNHDFVRIHSFLTELPLKSTSARQDFFTSLTERLRNFDENVIGSQLTDLLLSRVVLLDQNAQLYLLPFLLRPQNEDNLENLEQGLFTQEAFIRFLIPKLKKVFLVREIQIRLILLEFFPQYCSLFNKDELTDHILPQLLLGIKDTNDLLVTKTLICLAELIPILGATLVIGANRKKLFSDGRPNVDNVVFNNNEPRSITPVINSIDILSSSPPLGNISDVSNNESDHKLSKMILKNGDLSDKADGLVEDQGTDNEVEDGDEWSWDDTNANGNPQNNGNELNEELLDLEEEDSIEKSPDNLSNLEETNSLKSQRESPKRSSKESSRKSSVESYRKASLKLTLGKKEASEMQDNFTLAKSLKDSPEIREKPIPIVPNKEKDYSKRNTIPDIDELDIKNQKFSKIEEKSKEFDFFKDMAPVIQKTSVLVIDENAPTAPDPSSVTEESPKKEKEATKPIPIPDEPIQVNNKLFEMKIEEEEVQEGWEDDTDW